MFQLDEDAGKEQLGHWIRWAQHCRIPAFVELQRKIRRHHDAILATDDEKEELERMAKAE